MSIQLIFYFSDKLRRWCIYAVEFSNNKTTSLNHVQTEADELACRFYCLQNLIIKNKAIIKF